MNLKNKSIMDEFRLARNDFILLGDVVSNLMHDIVKQCGVTVLAIEHRVKQEDSLAGKLEIKGDKYKNLSDITDILGTRIVCSFADDVDRLSGSIESVFVIDHENSVDKREQLDPNAFGYLSLHYICSLPFGKQYPDAICGKKFEIQIRSALQHAWSSALHDIGYKSEFGVPRHIVREYSRLAGLLELADEQFVHIREYMHYYTAEVKDKITEGRMEKLKIDMISLREYMLRNVDMQSLLTELASICGSEINFVNPEMYIRQLAWLGKTTLDDLHRMLHNNRDTALRLAKRALEGSELDILSSTVGLRFLCQAELLQQGYSEERILQFMMLSTENRNRALRQAKALLNSVTSTQGENI